MLACYSILEKINTTSMTRKMRCINVGLFVTALLMIIGLSVGFSVNSFRGRDALDYAPLIDG